VVEDVTLGSHQRSVGKSQVHITPRWIIDSLGPFDLDPCAADPRPWDCARDNIVEAEDGLAWEWDGFVWMNPPFHRYRVEAWLVRMAEHNNGIALLHARTETKWFAHCWSGASALLFFATRLNFCKPDGTPNMISKKGSKYNGRVGNSGAPPVLVAFGDEAFRRLDNCKIPGALVTLWVFR
jgi:hypothetical protein